MARIAGVPAARAAGRGQAPTRSRRTSPSRSPRPRRWRSSRATGSARGFRALKVKVGKDVDADVRALEAIGRAAPRARAPRRRQRRLLGGRSHRARARLRAPRAARRVLGAALRGRTTSTEWRGSPRRSRRRSSPTNRSSRWTTCACSLERRYADGVNLKLAKSGGPARLPRHRPGGARARVCG